MLLLQITVTKLSVPVLLPSDNCSKKKLSALLRRYLKELQPNQMKTILVVSPKKTGPQCHSYKQNCYRKGVVRSRSEVYYYVQ